MFNRPHRDQTRRLNSNRQSGFSLLVPASLDPLVDDLDAAETDRANYLIEKRSFFLVGFEQSEAQPGSVDLERQPGETGAGAKVQDVRRREFRNGRIRVFSGQEIRRQKERFTKMAGDDGIWLAHRGQIDARVPT